MKASRLLNLLLILQTRERLTTAELADRLEVSRRTVLRDVDALSAAGVPVYAERGRSGGIVLLPGARLNASHLEPGELEALSVVGLDRDQLDQLGLTAVREQVSNKIAARQAATPGSASEGARLADLVVVDNTPWLAEATPTVDIADLALDLRRRRRLRVRYRRSSQPAPADQVVDPYGLASKGGRWYLVADVAGVAQLFSLQRLERYDLLDEPAVLRDGQSLRTVWSALRDRTEAKGGVTVTARLRTSRLDLAHRILGTRLREVGEADDEWTVVSLDYPEIEAVRQLLQFADHVEVLAPTEARDRFHRLALDIAERHRS